MDWIVIGKTKFSRHNPSYLKLREGDVIKFGKLMFKVREIKNELLNQNTLNQLSEDNSNDNSMHGDNSNYKELLLLNTKKKQQKSCRICLLEGETQENPLLHLCGCIGSVRFIHLDCLRQWLISKVTVKKNEHTTSYCYKSFQCEICKSFIPEKIKYKDKEITLIDLDNPTLPYVTFQVINREKTDLEMLYVVSMKNKSRIKIGRANDSDLRFTDISVSRNHAQLVYNEGILYLEDTKSKFGSLTLMQSALNFLPNLPVSIQKGKFHLKFQLKPTLLSKLCCYKNKDFNNIGYNDTYCYQTLLIHLNELGQMKSFRLDATFSLSSKSDESHLNAIPLAVKAKTKGIKPIISHSDLETINKEIEADHDNKFKTLPLDSSKIALIRIELKKTLNENCLKESKPLKKRTTNRQNTNSNNSLESENCLVRNTRPNQLLTINKDADDDEKKEKEQCPYSIIPGAISRMLSNPEQFEAMSFSMTQKNNPKVIEKK